MNPTLVAPAVGTTTLKIENPFDRWQNVAKHLGLLAVDGLSTYRIGKEAPF
jgi:hypothetical protein